MSFLDKLKAMFAGEPETATTAEEEKTSEVAAVTEEPAAEVKEAEVAETSNEEVAGSSTDSPTAVDSEKKEKDSEPA